MGDSALVIAGISMSRSVVAAIVGAAAEKVEGVASVGPLAKASNLVSVFFTKSQSAPEPDPIDVWVEEDKLHISIHLTVLYGYPFTALAQSVRDAVARAIKEQIGVEVFAVDIAIDSLVFPKE